MSGNVATGFGISIAIAAALAIVSGGTHGWLDGRWVAGPDIDAIGKRLNDLPEQMGDWVMVSGVEFPESALKMLRCYGTCSRSYRHTKSGAQVSIALMVGPRGPIAVHTPEVCYPGQGSQIDGKTQKFTVADGDLDNSFWRVKFRARDAISHRLEVAYAWSDGGPWVAADQPRLWPTDRLYKIQASTEAQDVSPIDDFLSAAVPSIKPLLQP